MRSRRVLACCQHQTMRWRHAADLQYRWGLGEHGRLQSIRGVCRAVCISGRASGKLTNEDVITGPWTWITATSGTSATSPFAVIVSNLNDTATLLPSQPVERRRHADDIGSR